MRALFILNALLIGFTASAEQPEFPAGSLHKVYFVKCEVNQKVPKNISDIELLQSTSVTCTDVASLFAGVASTQIVNGESTISTNEGQYDRSGVLCPYDRIDCEAYIQSRDLDFVLSAAQSLQLKADLAKISENSPLEIRFLSRAAKIVEIDDRTEDAGTTEFHLQRALLVTRARSH